MLIIEGVNGMGDGGWGGGGGGTNVHHSDVNLFI